MSELPVSAGAAATVGGSIEPETSGLKEAQVTEVNPYFTYYLY